METEGDTTKPRQQGSTRPEKQNMPRKWSGELMQLRQMSTVFLMQKNRLSALGQSRLKRCGPGSREEGAVVFSEDHATGDIGRDEATF